LRIIFDSPLYILFRGYVFQIESVPHQDLNNVNYISIYSAFICQNWKIKSKGNDK
jgi:hypothetical protein